MINAFSGNGSLMVSSASTSHYAASGGYSGRELEGDVRMNGTALEVFTCGAWMPIDSSINIELTPDNVAALEWAKGKMEEEKRLNELCDKHPGLKTLKEKYETYLALVEND